MERILENRVMILNSTLERTRRLVLTAFWVIFDQGIYSIANFTTNILFARWLTPVNYGWFAMSFSGALLVMALHTGAILEPILIQSAQIPTYRRRPYVISLVNAHLILLAAVACLAVLGYAVCAFCNNKTLGWVIATSLLGGTVLSILSAGRRICGFYVSPRMSGFIGLLYLVGTVSTVALVRARTTVEWLDIWLILGIWACLGAVATFWISHRRTSGDTAFNLSDLMSFAGRFAHWGLVSSVVGWTRSEGLFVILARVAGLGAVAETRAIYNISTPLLQINMAAHVSAIVWFSSNAGNASKRMIWRLIGLVTGCSAVLIVIVYVLEDYIVQLVYGGRYLAASWQLSLYCLSLTMYGLDAIISSACKSQGLMFRGYGSGLLAGAISVALGLILIPIQNLVIYVIVISSAIGLIAAILFRMTYIDRPGR
jgi:O-antigen/teichoic acid export membrane protein